MTRPLRRRIDALRARREPREVVAAISVIVATGDPPAGRAGERAAEIWAEAAARGIHETRALWCYQRATGKTLADLSAEATQG